MFKQKFAWQNFNEVAIYPKRLAYLGSNQQPEVKVLGFGLSPLCLPIQISSAKNMFEQDFALQNYYTVAIYPKSSANNGQN